MPATTSISHEGELVCFEKTDMFERKTILFDLDHTLLDTSFLKDTHHEVIRQELNISREEFRRALKDYVGALESTTDFDPRGFADYLGKKFKSDSSTLLSIYENDKIYKLALYPEALQVLKLLSKESQLGIYSEGEVNYQTKKLVKTGIIEFLDKNLIFIFRRKMEKENIKKLPESIVVDDKIEIARALAEDSTFKPIWLNRRTKEKDSKVMTIHGLSELL